MDKLEMLEKAREKALNCDELEYIGLVDKQENMGFAIVKGETSSYKVNYLWDKDHNNMYGYECSCPHNQYRHLTCKHMYKLDNELDNFTIVE